MRFRCGMRRDLFIMELPRFFHSDAVSEYPRIEPTPEPRHDQVINVTHRVVQVKNNLQKHAHIFGQPRRRRSLSGFTGFTGLPPESRLVSPRDAVDGGSTDSPPSPKSVWLIHARSFISKPVDAGLQFILSTTRVYARGIQRFMTQDLSQTHDIIV